MKVYQTSEIRNVALVGSARSGKTILGEALLFMGGVVTRRGTIEDKNTISDYKEIELERQSSVYASPLFTEYNNHKINIIDCPGVDDFVGDVVSSLHVSDTALLVLNSQNGVEVGSELAWRQTNKANMPVVLLANQLDHEKANFDELLKEANQMLSSKISIIQYPVNPGIGFDSVIDVMKMKMLKFSADGKYQELEIPANEKDKAEDLQGKLIEAAAESDEALMEKFFEDGTLTEEEIFRGLKAGLISRGIFPLFCISAKQNFGTARLLEVLISSVPSPEQSKLLKLSDGKDIAYNATGNPQLIVFKTSIEQHLGEVSYFKVTNGTITESLDMVNFDTDSKERLSQLFAISGKTRVKVEKLLPGDIGATIKLRDTKTGNTLNGGKAGTEKVEGIVYPESRHRAALRAKNTSDDEKLGGLLRQIHTEDPSLTFENSVELKQIIVSGQGELHLNIAKWIIEKINKIDVEYYSPKIPYRETITKQSKAMYRHKKQSGGAGQFGEVHMLIQPYTPEMKPQTEFAIRGTEEHILPWGGKLIYNNCVVGGAIDARFMPAILKGIMEKIEEGPLTGSYARDIVVNIYDGKMHDVDSNELAFKLAGRQAFREAFKTAGPKILEPICDVEVMVPEERMGDVMTDLQGRRAIIMGMEGEGVYQRIKARVPLAEMNRYSTSLSALTSGRGNYGMKIAEYQQVPSDVQDVLLKAYEAQEAQED
ncbi:MAG: elongation factor G [Bacteroidota bacterium]